jgi:YHS domain-containing protein
MIPLRKYWWAALIGSALAGCAEEQATQTTPPPTPPTSTGPLMKPKVEDTNPTPTPPPSEPKAEVPKKDLAPPIEPPKVESPKADEPKTAAAVKLSDEELAEIKKLPAAEQAVALQQKLCPVSGENLGGMGVPFKVSAEGKTFYLCCKSCEKDVKENPQAVIAKLGK